MTKENDMRSAISGDEPPALNNDRAVTRIAATNQSAPLKVAAYCRVSTLMPEQQMSMESQEVHYRKAIEEHPGWALAGIYSDQRSGTDADSRPALQQLLQDSREGRVDLILTKSLSRFARNTTECLQMVRELLSLHVNILFEKENLDTRDTGSELLLTTLASVAEQESYSISDNLKWGIRKRFASGNYHPSIPPYGYRKGEKGLEIDPEEANIVREINEKLLSGIGASTIAAELNARGVNTGRNGYWSYQKVRDIAENPVYVGDALYQQTYMDENFCQRVNDGVLDQYYHEDQHEPILDRTAFQHAKALFSSERRIPSGDDAFSGQIICARCGCPMNRRTSKGLVTFVCSASRRHRESCGNKPVRKSTICRVSMTLLNKLSFSQCPPQTGVIDGYIDHLTAPQKRADIEALLVKNQEAQAALISSAVLGLSMAELHTQRRALSLDEARLKKSRDFPANGVREAEALKAFVSNWSVTDKVERFPAEAFSSFLSHVVVETGIRATFFFSCGLILTESLAVDARAA